MRSRLWGIATTRASQALNLQARRACFGLPLRQLHRRSSSTSTSTTTSTSTSTSTTDTPSSSSSSSSSRRADGAPVADKNKDIEELGRFGAKGGFDMTAPADKQVINIRGYGDTSFQINEVQANQSVLLFRKSFLLWNARTFDDITIESLAIFALLHPTIEVLFIGCGEVQPRQLPADVVQFFKAKGIVLEASTSVNAAATFNILISEGRNVAAALLTNQPTELD